MKAPEKIYVRVKDGKAFSIWNSEWVGVNDIEYVQIDVFIDKACKFLKSYRQDTHDGTGYIAGIVNDKTIEDFRNYMKGE